MNVIHFNATQAAIHAAYSEKTAEQQGSRLLNNVKIAAAIAKRQAALADKLEPSPERVLVEKC